MRSMTSPPWKSRTVPLDWLTTMARAAVALLIAAPAQCRAPRPLRQRQIRVRGIDELGRFFDDAFGVDDERPIEHRRLL